MEQEPAPPPSVTVRNTWTWGKDGARPQWGVILRSANGQQHVVTADTPEGVGAAVTAHLRSLAAPMEAAA